MAMKEIRQYLAVAIEALQTPNFKMYLSKMRASSRYRGRTSLSIEENYRNRFHVSSPIVGAENSRPCSWESNHMNME